MGTRETRQQKGKVAAADLHAWHGVLESLSVSAVEKRRGWTRCHRSATQQVAGCSAHLRRASPSVGDAGARSAARQPTVIS